MNKTLNIQINLILFWLRKIVKDRVFKCMRIKCSHNCKYVHNLLTHAALLKRCLEITPPGERKKKRTKVFEFVFIFFNIIIYLLITIPRKRFVLDRGNG